MFTARFKILLIIVVVLLITGALIVSGKINTNLSRKETIRPIAQKPTATQPTATPTPLPLTTESVDNELTTADAAIQAVVGQVDADLESLNSIDSQQDSVSF